MTSSEEVKLTGTEEEPQLPHRTVALPAAMKAARKEISEALRRAESLAEARALEMNKLPIGPLLDFADRLRTAMEHLDAAMVLTKHDQLPQKVSPQTTREPRSLLSVS